MFGNRGGIGGKFVAFVIAGVVLLLALGAVAANFAGGGVDPALIESCLPLRDAAQLDRCISEGSVR